MAVAGKRERRSLWIATIPMALLALSCVYPILFAVNNALKTDKGYILDRFGMVTEPTLQNFADAWGRARFSEYFVNSVAVTVGAVGLLLLTRLARGLRAGHAALPRAAADLHPDPRAR